MSAVAAQEPGPSDRNDDQYELVHIFSPDEISSKRAKCCTVCGRRVACCVWKSTLTGTKWKYCLDCQDENFPEWIHDWNSFFLHLSPSFLTAEHRSVIISKCRACNSDVTLPHPFPLNDDAIPFGEGKEEEPSNDDVIFRPEEEKEEEQEAEITKLSNECSITKSSDYDTTPPNQMPFIINNKKRKTLTPYSSFDDATTLNSDENKESSLPPNLIDGAQTSGWSDTSVVPSIPPIIPPKQLKSSKPIFMALPDTDDACISVDYTNGLFYTCKYCGHVNVRRGRPFTIDTWNRHVVRDQHKMKKMEWLDLNCVIKKKKERGESLTMREQKILKDRRSVMPSLLSFGFGRRVHKTTSSAASDSSKLITDSFTSSVSSVSSAASELKNPSFATSATLSQLMTCSCGIISNYREPNMGEYLRWFVQYGSGISSSFKTGFHQQSPTLFSPLCKSGYGKYRTGVIGKNQHLCDSCFSIRKSNSIRKIRQVLKDKAEKYQNAVHIIGRNDLTKSDGKAMVDFLKTPDYSLSERGLTLKNSIRLQLNYYNEVQSSKGKKEICRNNEGIEGITPGIDTFPKLFMETYETNDSFKQSMIVSLCKCLLAKASGHQNVKYGDKVTNFMLALSVHNKRAFEYVSANLDLMSSRWMRAITASKRNTPFIDCTETRLLALLRSKFDQIRTCVKDDRHRISFSVGIDATVLAKTFSLHHPTKSIVGGVGNNAIISIDQLNPEEIKSILKDCVEGKYGPLAAEIKVAIISIQNTPIGMSPYFVLCGNPQSINETNDFSSRVMSICQQAASIDGNAVVLNNSTDGVSCEVEANKQCVLSYLNGEINYLSLPDPNHNAKNLRYQLIGGSSAASIGSFCFDPHILLASSIQQELIRIEDYASDALVLKLASSKSITKIVNADPDPNDVGNTAVTTLSLLFLRVRLFSVNGICVPWKTRAILHFASLIWFTSFHTSGSTMMTNKRNMVLETFAILFLVSRNDVSQPRRCTSESNEHTFGNWRQIMREFNLQQLIDIVNKVSIQNDAIFEGNLIKSRTGLKGYQSTYADYIKSLRIHSIGEIESYRGPTCVLSDKPAVYQTWPEVMGVMKYVVSVLMTPFLSIFGVTEKNGLSPFAISDLNTPKDLREVIIKFFEPPKVDRRDQDPTKASHTNSSLNMSLETDFYDTTDTPVDVTASPHSSMESSQPQVQELPSNSILGAHLSAILAVPEGDDKGGGTSSMNRSTTSSDDSHDNDDRCHHERNEMTDSSSIIGTFISMLTEAKMSNLNNLFDFCCDIMSMLDLSGNEKGSSLSEGKTKSLQQRWFGAKSSSTTNRIESGNKGIIESPLSLLIRRNTLVTMKCKRGRHESIEYYRVLALFTKYYNKWFIAPEGVFPFDNTSKNVRVLARMVKKHGSAYEEVKLDENGQFGPKSIFCMKYMCDVLTVEQEELKDY